ncbi:Di-copper centre-containing protein [Sistotremastrum niveocremeum HHB9708]|uniref:tyrosinase n=1 Tax=Sistotremastrum niveocremeum HHB9708 TaxID=1314777 RepID=A0A164RA64_9AGAM|nr:Di-copper centre-containing protein [Sistotremastrum niveocremeum HHB9708]
MSTFPITGVPFTPGPRGQVPIRQDVDSWYLNPQNGKQVSLFLVALQKFQQIPYAQKLSYFQIAGIHGLPLIPWDENTQSKSPGYGYCTHNSILFPTWHRPYMFLFEQRIYEIMIQEVIPQSVPPNDRPEYIALAKDFRLPFWDWAKKPTDLPAIAKDPTISVFFPQAKYSIPNPFYKFTTTEVMGNLGITDVDGVPYSKVKATSKCPPVPKNPLQSDWINGTQDNAQVVTNLRTHAWYQPKDYGTIGEAVYRLLSENYFSTYDAFASTRLTQGQPPADYLSIEGIHNNIHNWTGGDNGGHMSSPPVSSFDPIFWLHHCNVDRQFAIWQALNPNAWFTDPSQQLTDPAGNWSTPAGTKVNPKWALAPFHVNTNGLYYNSDDIRDWQKYGYSYPELQPWLPQYWPNGQFNQLLYTASIKAAVNNLYSNSRSVLLGSTPSSDDKASHHDYVVNVVYKKFALGGDAFKVHIYVGKDKEVGTVYNFSARPDETGGPEGCGNCRSQQEDETLATGQVHITVPLLHDVEDSAIPLSSLHPDHVEEYLKKNLHWKVTKLYGEEVPLDSISSLKVSLAVGTGEHYKDETQLSKYHSYRILHSVTEGRAGGLGHSEHY